MWSPRSESAATSCTVATLSSLGREVRDTGGMSWSQRLRESGSRRARKREQPTEQERDGRTQLAVTAERNRIAREMHDIVAHNLSVMIALTDGAELTLDRDP